MVKVNLKSNETVKPKVLNADQKFDLGPIKKGDRGYLNKNLTKKEEKLGVGYLGMPTFQPYIVVDCKAYATPPISGISCILPKETTLRVVLPENYPHYVNSYPAIARVRYWDINAKYFNKIPPLSRSVGTKISSKVDSRRYKCKNQFKQFRKDNPKLDKEECQEYFEDRDREDPDCPYYTNHSWYDWFGEDACGHGKWKMANYKHLKVDSKSVKTNQDKGPQYYSPNDPKFDPDLFLTGEYPRVGGIDMGGIEGLGMHIPWIKAPKGYKNTSGMKQLKM